jgi:hypothetical protein
MDTNVDAAVLSTSLIELTTKHALSQYIVNCGKNQLATTGANNQESLKQT